METLNKKTDYFQNLFFTGGRVYKVQIEVYLFEIDLSKTSWICTELKLESPIDFTSPFSTSFSMANHVSVGCVSRSYMTDPSGFLGITKNN